MRSITYNLLLNLIWYCVIPNLSLILSDRNLISFRDKLMTSCYRTLEYFEKQLIMELRRNVMFVARVSNVFDSDFIRAMHAFFPNPPRSCVMGSLL